jgi:hypothetical protein
MKEQTELFGSEGRCGLVAPGGPVLALGGLNRVGITPTGIGTTDDVRAYARPGLVLVPPTRATERANAGIAAHSDWSAIADQSTRHHTGASMFKHGTRQLWSLSP